MPILPVYAQSIGASLSMVGIIVAAYAIPQMLFRIPIGMLFDIITRRKFLIAGGIMMSSAGALGLGLAPSALLLFFARGITGIGAAAWVTFTVYFVAYYPKESARRAIGTINFVQGAALVIATYCGGIVAEIYGYSFTFFGAALIGVIALIVLLATKERTSVWSSNWCLEQGSRHYYYDGPGIICGSGINCCTANKEVR